MNATRTALAAVALSLAYAGPLFAADTMGKDAAKSERQRIAADAKAAREKCNSMKANEKDICMAQAKGQERIAKAELAAKQKDTPKNRYDVALAKADMEHNVAREKCDEMKGKDKEACQKDAKTARDNARKQAKSERDAAEGRKDGKAKKDA